MTYGPTLFGQEAAGMGLHAFPHPAANMSRAYTNPLRVQLAACTYCGFCEKFGCGNDSKSSPQTTILPVLMTRPNFELRTHAEVMKVELSSDRRHATGVSYVDENGMLQFQPASVVILSAFMLENARL